MSLNEIHLNNIEKDDQNLIKESEKIKLLDKLKKQLTFEFNGLFYIILSIIILAVSLTVAMVLCIFYGPPQIRPHAGISTEVTECSELGLNICKQGGSAVDSAIGSYICLTIIRPDIVGLGGCGSMLIHNHSSMVSEIIDFSCMSPQNPSTTVIPDGFGVKQSVAIPGILSGLKLAHGKYGKMNWTNILQLTIDKLKTGIKITDQMKIASSSPQFLLLPTEYQTLYKDWTTSPTFIPSENILNIVRNLQNDGPMSGISGALANEIINLGFPWSGSFDIARIQKPLKALFGDFSLITAPLPSKGGLDLALTVDILNKLVFQNGINKESSAMYHVILESLKVVQAFTSFLGDSNDGIEDKIMSLSSIETLSKQVNLTKTQTNDHYGPYYFHSDIEMNSGSHISVIDSNSLYVSLSANIGSKFGSGIVTKSGIILNDAMRLFTPNDTSYLVPGQQIINNTKCGNIAKSGKRPFNQLTPLMVYNVKRKCGIRFAVGGDHGSRSTTGSLQMTLSAIFMDQKFCPSKDCLELKNAGDKSRIHINILDSNIPNSTARLYIEPDFPDAILNDLVTIYKYNNYDKKKNLQSLYSIGKVQYEIKGFADSRGGGNYIYF